MLLDILKASLALPCVPTSDYDDETVKEKKNAEKFYTSDATAQRFFIAQQQPLTREHYFS